MSGKLASIPRDKQGYLKSLQDWTPEIAQELAGEEGLQLSEEYLEIIEILQAFYRRYEITPNTRVLVKTVRETLGSGKGTSMYLMQLFPGGAVKQGCKIAGLPKPSQCF